MIMSDKAEEARLNNIIDMGLTFSVMVRLYKKGTKGILRGRLTTVVKEVFEAKSEDEFRVIYSNFCWWS